MTHFLRDTGFRSLGSVAVYTCVVLWHLGGVLFIVGGLPAQGLGEFGATICRVALYSVVALIPLTIIFSATRHFGPLRHPFDYHGPILSVLTPVAMIAEAFFLLAGVGIR